MAHSSWGGVDTRVVVLIATERRAAAASAIATLKEAGCRVSVRVRLPRGAVVLRDRRSEHLVVVIDTQSYLTGPTTAEYRGILLACAALMRDRRGPTSVITVNPDPGVFLTHILALGRVVTASAGPWSDGGAVPSMVEEVVRRATEHPPRVVE